MKKHILPAVLLAASAFALTAFGAAADTDTGFTPILAEMTLSDNGLPTTAATVTPMRVAGNGLPGNPGECFDTDIVTCSSDSIGEDAARWPWSPPPVPAGASCNSCHASNVGAHLRPD